jgi:hypothetical protein
MQSFTPYSADKLCASDEILQMVCRGKESKLEKLGVKLVPFYSCQERSKREFFYRLAARYRFGGATVVSFPPYDEEDNTAPTTHTEEVVVDHRSHKNVRDCEYATILCSKLEIKGGDFAGAMDYERQYGMLVPPKRQIKDLAASSVDWIECTIGNDGKFTIQSKNGLLLCVRVSAERRGVEIAGLFQKE